MPRPQIVETLEERRTRQLRQRQARLQTLLAAGSRHHPHFHFKIAAFYAGAAEPPKTAGATGHEAELLDAIQQNLQPDRVSLDEGEEVVIRRKPRERGRPRGGLLAKEDEVIAPEIIRMKQNGECKSYREAITRLYDAKVIRGQSLTSTIDRVGKAVTRLNKQNRIGIK